MGRRAKRGGAGGGLEGKGGRRGGRNMDRLPSIGAPTGDQTWNLVLCPDWVSIQPPFGVQDRAQPMEQVRRIV